MTVTTQTPSQAAVSSECMRHIRRNYFFVGGRVKIEGNEVSLYSRDGLKVLSLACTGDEIEKFRKFDGISVKPFPTRRSYDEFEGREYFSPMIK